MSDEQKKFFDSLLARSLSKRRVAYRLLRLSIGVMIGGLFVVIWQLQDIGKSEDVLQVVARISFVVFFFYMCQVLLKLYRYNMLLSDFYTACCDAIDMGELFDNAKQDSFQKLVQALNPGSSLLNDTDPPKLSDILAGKKDEK